MPRAWGSWSGTSSSGARYRVGFDWSRSGTRVTVDQYVFESAYSIGKDVTLTRTGALSGTYSVGVSTSGGVVSLGRGGSVTGSRGGSVTVGGRVTDILHGLTCSVSETISIPALPPSTPSRPSVSRVTATSALVSWRPPNNNGSSIIEYGYRAERGGSLQDGGYTTSWSGTVTGLEPNTRYGARVRARNSAGWSSFSTFRYFTTDVAHPSAPSNFTANRVNDNRVNLSWSRNATSGAPYDRILIRRQTNSGSWYNLATVSGSATGYTDTSTSYGNSYYYNVRAINAAGQSGYTNPSGGRVYMRPWSPPTPTAKKQGANIRVSWDSSSSDYATGYRIYDSPDGGPWVQVGSTSSRSWTHLDPDPSVTHTYSVSSTRGSLEGNRSLSSNTVQLQAPPLAPTLISPGDGVVLPRTDEVDLVWRHESVDTTDQTEYEVAYRVVATDEVTIYTGTTAESHTIAASDLSGEIRWNARTKGADPSFGPWSPANTFMLASVPSVVIQSPVEDTLPTPRVSVVWSYADADEHPQATWQAELWAGEDLIEQASGHGADTTDHAFEARLDDAVEYTIRLRARSGAGLWSDWDETYFTTDFPLPVTIEPSLEWDRSTGSVMVTLATDPFEPGEGETVPEVVEVERRDAGGEWVLIGSGLDPMTSIVDPTPRLGEVTYRVVSRTTLPSESVGPEVVISWERRSSDPSVFVTGGQEMSVVCTAQGGSRSNTPSVEQSAVRFAGQSRPTAMFGTGDAYEVSFTGKIVHTATDQPVSSREEWEALLREFSIVCYRDTTGVKVFGLLSVDFSLDRVVEQVSVEIERVRYIEDVERIADADLELGEEEAA